MNKIEKPAAIELLKKIQKLEEDHAYLKEEISKLIISGEHDRKPVDGGEALKTCSLSLRQSDGGFSAVNLTESQCMNILESMGQSVHMFDLDGRIIYWNQMAQHLYGYTVSEALGKTAPEIIINPNFSELATLIIKRAAKGETWFGEFPMRNRIWEMFSVISTVSPSRDEHGNINGVLCVCADSRPFRELRPQLNVNSPWKISSAKFRLDPQQPLQTAITSKISNLASKVKLKMKTRDSDNTHCSDFAPNVSSTNDQFVEKPITFSGLSSKAEEWMGKKGISWPWRRNQNENGIGRFSDWSWLHNDQQQEFGQHTSCNSSLKLESQPYESAISSNNTNGAPDPCSSSCGPSSSGSTNSSSVIKFDINIENLDVEISWVDLTIGEQIGQGSCGTVYHALWFGSDVAVKVFIKQEYSDDIILSFRKEVSLMKRLRHPNILLFMGAVTSPEHLSIVTECLPRGSLFQLLQRDNAKLDWRRRIHMAMDIARGMNYLHHCNPPIIHRDLKSSNLLVDKNWTVKVGDFGLSRIKRESYLTTKSGKGTPQWMAPEVLRNQQADEKSDVYSYGVVLWEITTKKIPWDNLDPMQVIGAVGFMNQRLEIPKDVNPQWATLIESCLSSEPESRPMFQEILSKLKDLQKTFAVPRRDNKSSRS